MSASPASFTSVDVGSSRLCTVLFVGTNHAQGVLADCGMRVGCEVTQDRFICSVDRRQASTARAVAPGDWPGF